MLRRLGPALYVAFGGAVLLAVLVPDLRLFQIAFAVKLLVLPLLVSLPLASHFFRSGEAWGIAHAFALAVMAVTIHNVICVGYYAAKVGKWNYDLWDEKTQWLMVTIPQVQLVAVVLVFLASWLIMRFRSHKNRDIGME